jgi:iron complex transport system substrate-binding protein
MDQWQGIPMRKLFLSFLLLLPLHVRAAELTDATGRTVQLPEHIARVLPAGPPAAVLLATLAPDLMVGWPMPLSAAARAALLPPLADLPQVPRLTGREDVTQAVRGLKPDLILDYGTVSPEYAALARRTQEAIGVPAVLLDGALPALPAVLRALGAALHREARAEALARQAEAVLALPPPAKRLRVVYARGPEGMQVAAAGTGATEVFERLGWQVLVPQGDLRAAKPDAVAALDADLIVLADPQSLAKVRQWPGLRARVVVDPGQPFGWVSEPPSINRLMGLVWLRGLEAAP